MARYHSLNSTCVCKGKRSCLLCEGEIITNNIKPKQPQESNKKKYTYCSSCGKAWKNSPGDIIYRQSETNCESQHLGEGYSFKGVDVITDFLSAEEEEWLIEQVDSIEWILSQSGRWKQDYGPKVNFKRKKIKMDAFTGLPFFGKFLYEKMTQIPSLKHFVPVELCNLEYIPDRGSSIDPHFDDFWLWGERLVTLNLLSDTQYTMTTDKNGSSSEIQVVIPFPRRSLMVLYGPARHQWMHSISRNDIYKRRVGITIRELSKEFLPGGTQESVGKKLTDIALTFNGLSVGEFEKLNRDQSNNIMDEC